MAQGKHWTERADEIRNDQKTMDAIRQMSQDSGIHWTDLAAKYDVERAETDKEKARRSDLYSRKPGDSFAKYAEGIYGNIDTETRAKSARQTDRTSRRNTDVTQTGANDRQEAEIAARIKLAEQADTRANRQEQIRNNNNLQLEKISQDHDLDMFEKRQEAEAAAVEAAKPKSPIQQSQEIQAEIADIPEGDTRRMHTRNFILTLNANNPVKDTMKPEEWNQYIEDMTNNELKKSHQSYFTGIGENGVPNIGLNRPLPPGLVQEMKPVVDGMTFEEFLVYVDPNGLQDDDLILGSYYTDLTGRDVDWQESDETRGIDTNYYGDSPPITSFWDRFNHR